MHEGMSVFHARHMHNWLEKTDIRSILVFDRNIALEKSCIDT